MSLAFNGFRFESESLKGRCKHSLTSNQEISLTLGRAALPDIPVSLAQGKQKTGNVRVGWSRSFRDGTLTKFVREAQTNNPDIRAAAAKVQSPQALARQTGATLSPQLNFSSDGSRSGAGAGPSRGNLNLGLQASWEIELRGRLRSRRNTVAKGCKRDSLRALEFLLGRHPGADFQVRKSLPPMPSPPPAGVPSPLLERRPDLIDGGARKAQIDADKANQRAAVNAYASAALKAFGNVQKSLDSGTVIPQRRSLLTQSLTGAESALDVAEKNNKAVETNLFEVL